MYSNACHYFVLLVFILLEGVRAQGVNLGKLHWCETRCLCHDDTLEQMHCFNVQDIYSLMEVDPKKVQRLSRVGFEMEEKLTWCKETCLCHKAGGKVFTCTNSVRLGEFIENNAPHLIPYLEREVIEEPIEEPIAEGEDEGDRKDRHERRRKKHRKNRKKSHRGQKPEEDSKLPQEEVNMTEEPILPSPTTRDAVAIPTPQEERKILTAGIFGGASGPSQDAASSMRSDEDDDTYSPVLEVPRERKTVVGKVASNLDDLRVSIDHIKEDISFNQQIMLGALVATAVAVIGVLVLAIYLCCVRKSAKMVPNSPKKSPLRQESNNLTKVNIDEAW